MPLPGSRMASAADAPATKAVLREIASQERPNAGGDKPLPHENSPTLYPNFVSLQAARARSYQRAGSGEKAGSTISRMYFASSRSGMPQVV